MNKTIACLLASATALTAAPALAASDIFMEIEGLDGEATPVPAPVESWSFGVCNAGACSSTKRTMVSSRTSGGAVSGKRNHDHSHASDASAGRVNQGLQATGSALASGAAVADLDGDGAADLAFIGTQDAVSSLSLTFDKASPQLIKLCDGKHFDSVKLRVAGETYTIAEGTGTCTLGGAGTQGQAIAKIDSTPARISTNFTVGKQTQTQSFGEKVQAGMASAGSLTITFTSGQMKNKTGHITTLK